MIYTYPKITNFSNKKMSYTCRKKLIFQKKNLLHSSKKRQNLFLTILQYSKTLFNKKL